MGIFRLGDDFIGDRKVKVKVQAMNSMSIDFNPEIHRLNGKLRGYGIKINKNVSKEEILEQQKEKEKVETYAREHSDEIDDEVHKACWASLVALSNHFRPSEVIYIVVDGSPPRAKGNQQRQRRYKTAKFRNDEKGDKEDDKEKKEVSTGSGFDTNNISPGTRYMRRLCAYLEAKIKEDSRKKEPELSARRVIFSNDLVPGEGEHKIMEAFRDGTIQLAKGMNVIVGVDNDLIPLALSLKAENLFFIRGFTDENKLPFNMTSIDRIRNLFLVELGLLYSIDDPTPKIAIPIERVISDLILLFSMISNDFLPTMPGFYALPFGLNALIKSYKTWQKFPDERVERSYLTNDEGLVLPALFDYFKILVKEEPMLLRSLRLNENFTQFKALEKATEVTTLKDTGRSKSDVEQRHVSLDLDRFHELWWRNFDRKTDVEIKAFPRVSTGFKEQVCRYFIEGLSWFFSYYMFGPTAINWNWFYPYYWAPTIYDLTAIEILPTDNWQRTEGTLTPLLNGLIIFPPSSFGLIPSSVRELVESGPLLDITPTDFELWEEGVWTGESHSSKPEQVIALLPFVSSERIIIEFLNLDIPDALLDKYAPQQDREYIYGKETGGDGELRANLSRRGAQSARGSRGRTPAEGGEFRLLTTKDDRERRAEREKEERESSSSRGRSSPARGSERSSERGSQRGRGSFTPRGDRGSGRGSFTPRGDRGRGSPRGDRGSDRGSGRGSFTPRGGDRGRGGFVPRGDRGSSRGDRGSRGSFAPRGRGRGSDFID